MPIAADRIADVRADLAGRGQLLQTVYESAIRDGRQLVRPTGPPAQAVAILARQEIARLRQARIFYVQPALAGQCVQAADADEPFTLTRDQLPAEAGRAYFTVPLGLNSDESEHSGAMPIGDPKIRSEVVIVAAAWDLWAGGPKHWSDGAIWVTWYSDTELNIMADVETGRLTEEVAAVASSVSPSLELDMETQIPFSATPIGAMYGGLYLRCARSLRALFVSMAEGSVADSPVVADRAARRRSERDGITDTTVHILDLRRELATDGAVPSDVGPPRRRLPWGSGRVP